MSRNATVTTLRPVSDMTRLLHFPMLARDVREKALEQLADVHLNGCPPLPALTELQVRALSSPRLSAEQAMAAWRDLLAEEDRWRAVQANEPDFRDVEPRMAEADRDAALADLLDGTSAYHGERTS